MKFTELTPLEQWTLRRMFLADLKLHKIVVATGFQAKRISAWKTEPEAFSSEIPVDERIQEMRDHGSSFAEMTRVIGQGPKYARWYLDEYKLSPSHLMDETSNKDLEQVCKRWIVKTGDIKVGMNATCLNDRYVRDLIARYKLRRWWKEWKAKYYMLDSDKQLRRINTIIDKENEIDADRIRYFKRTQPRMTVAEMAVRTNRHVNFVYDVLAPEIFKKAS